jgi:predicted transglutaminase-like cysteine proteinase
VNPVKCNGHAADWPCPLRAVALFINPIHQVADAGADNRAGVAGRPSAAWRQDSNDHWTTLNASGIASAPAGRASGPTAWTSGRGGLAWLLGLCLAGWVSAQGLVFGHALLDWMEQEYGLAARERAVALQNLVEVYADAAETEKLERVNRFFNRVSYASDLAVWGQEDYWATPYEILGLDAADCEDYAIAKYFTLTSMGVSEDRLRITYVKSLELDEAHMVLAYYADAKAEPLILDNLTDEMELAGRRTDLVPVYSFNGADLWLAANRVEGRRVGSSDRLSRWQEFQAKLMQQMAVGARERTP